MSSRPIAVALASVVAIGCLTLTACGPDAGKELFSERPAATSTAPAANPATATAAPVRLFDLGNPNGVRKGAKAPSFTLDKAALVTEIQTYHYIAGGGPTPGTIGLKASDGTLYGPWSTTGIDGQGGVKNAFWDAKPNVKVPAGTYTVVDSDPSTWSTNDAAKGLGFVTVIGTYSE
jgi:hypothetical protein